MNTFAFSTPDAVRHPASESAEALAFVATAEAFQFIPPGIELDECTTHMISGGCLDAAQTIHLLELASF